MPESLKISIDLPVSPERVFRAWLDSYEHSRFTGSPAKIGDRAGGAYTAFDGDIQGVTLVCSPYSRIVQTWRTREFPPGSPDTQIEIRLEPTCLGTQLILLQTGIPDGQSTRYITQWEARYLRPMSDYFEAMVGESSVDIDG